MTFVSILPANATKQERDVEAAISDIGGLPIPTRAVWSAADCPADLLPWLAWGLSIDDWNADWPEQVKRSRIAAAIPIQRRKGTAKSVADVVNSFGAALTLKEWWQFDPPQPPHTFSITLTVGGGLGSLPGDYVDAIIAEVTRTKPVRSRFTFTQGLSAAGAIRLVGVARSVAVHRVRASAE
ncbi:MAG: phage tail protein I [Sphingopyxis macrogoltabida]|uniref:Phage tail protein I n=1 Tax=Sphingopyxis macrogoltabida TaxID=33050 RepID=A0A2W5L362_SPHMC|nr:MAG: phage tail protein I [Sphingopyxis macrogoltabida]